MECRFYRAIDAEPSFRGSYFELSFTTLHFLFQYISYVLFYVTSIEVSNATSDI